MSDESFSPEFGTPYQALIDHCESLDLNFQAIHEHKAVRFSVQGKAALYDVTWIITHGDEVFEIYMTVPVAATDEKMRPLVAEFVTRANHRMVLGHFDFNMDDGKLRYHVGHAFGERELDDDAIGRLMATALDTVDRYFPALMRMMFGGHTPGDAVYLAELDMHAEAVEDTPKPPKSTPTAKARVPTKKRARRPRRDPRLKTTQELPGLFEKQVENGGKNAKDSPPPSS